MKKGKILALAGVALLATGVQILHQTHQALAQIKLLTISTKLIQKT